MSAPKEAAMTRQQTSLLTLKSIAGSVLAGPGIFVLRGTLNEIAAQLNQLRGSTPGEGLGVLQLVMLAASFNHHRIAQGLLQMFVTFWPLLPVIVGAGLLWNAFTHDSVPHDFTAVLIETDSLHCTGQRPVATRAADGLLNGIQYQHVSLQSLDRT